MVEATQRHSTARSKRLLTDWLGSLWLCSTALVLLTLSSGLLTHGASAAERSRPIRIGALTTSWGPTPEMAALRDRLLELGYHERDDFVLGVRFTQGDNAALLHAAQQLVAYDVDLIFAVGHTLVVQAAQKATTRIPIVFAAVSDPVEAGLIQSFARPGSNTTGVSDLDLELVPKRLEVFREMIPGLQRVLFPYDPADPVHLLEAQALRSAAHRLGIVLMEKPLRTEEEAKTVLAEIKPDVVDGILAPRCCSLNIPGFILETASPKSLPTMFQQVFWVEQGALASYGPDYYASGRQRAWWTRFSKGQTRRRSR